MNNIKLFEEIDSGFKKYRDDTINEGEKFLLIQNIELLKQESRSAEVEQVMNDSLKDFFGYEIQTEFFRATLADLVWSIYILAEKKAESQGNFENFLEKTDKTIAEFIASEKYFIELAENFRKIRQKWMEEYEKIQTRIENISQEIDILKEKYSDIYDLDQMFFDLKNDFEWMHYENFLRLFLPELPYSAIRSKPMLKKRYATNKKEFEVFYNSLKNKIEYLEKKINNFDRDFIRQQKNEKEKELALQKREIAKAAVNNSVSKDESPIRVPKQIREIVTTQQKEILKILSRVCGLEKIFLEKDFSDLQRYEIFTIRTEMEKLDSSDKNVMEIRDKIMKIIEKIYPYVNIF